MSIELLKFTTMYNNQSFNERIQGNVCNESYDFGHEESGKKYFTKWSPQEDMKFYSKSRYGSPRMLSKSVPRKNKNLTRCRINRSLNFDAGITKSDLKFKSPNSSSDSICYDDEKQLSRSAKIMRALNFGTSPISNGKKKVNKSLNFDFSPSPKKLLHYNGSPCNIVHLNLSTSSPKIGKSLNFESSPAESNISSILGTSIDSIDENQNQTPSERRRSVKKSLKYLTPQRKSNNNHFNFNEKSPLLRSELKEKIDNIIQMSTPDVHSLKKSHKKPPFVKDVFVSTPRNLFNDFQDVDFAGGPKTPNNRIRLVPESMSAIKRSHKKERFSRRLEVEVVTNEILEDDQLAQNLDIVKEQQPSTPPIQVKCKKLNSHKKEKMNFNQSIDELSEGSIFNYSGLEDISSSCEGDLDEVKTKKNEKIKVSEENRETCTPAKKMIEEICISSPINRNQTEIVVHPPDNENPTGPSTPKNRIDFLQRVIGSSIKKSHKKLKEEKKKRIPRPRIFDETSNNSNKEESQALDSNTERAATPENVNSSRLLLPNFSSVKKSHKKDKRSKILSNFARRQQIFSYDKEKLSNSCSDLKNKSPVKEDVKNYSLQHFNIQGESSKTCETSPLKSPHSPNSSESSYKRKLSSCSDVDEAIFPLSNDDSECLDFVTADDSFRIYTPIKKKKSAPTRNLTADEFEDDLENLQNVPLTRCVTPILDQSRTDESIHDNFVTPEKSINSQPKGNSTPKNKLTSKHKVTPDRKIKTNNKVTPKNNLSALELISNVNSVKKSHKKEKKGNRFSFKDESVRLNLETDTPIGEIKSPLIDVSTLLTPESSLHSNNTSDTSFKDISLMASKFLQSYRNNDCKPSTSYESKDDDIEKKQSSKKMPSTPPNSFKTKQFLKCQQTESIKKSHKKKRDELRHSILVQNLELSDDGSIFTEDERVENLPEDRAINKKKTGKNSNTRVSVVVNMNESLFDEETDKKSRVSCRSSRRIRKISNDGSLFGSDEDGSFTEMLLK